MGTPVDAFYFEGIKNRAGFTYEWSVIQLLCIYRSIFLCSGPKSNKPTSKLDFKVGLSMLAERGGFEPPLPLWGKHDFQSCAFSRTQPSLRIRLLPSIVYGAKGVNAPSYYMNKRRYCQ